MKNEQIDPSDTSGVQSLREEGQPPLAEPVINEANPEAKPGESKATDDVDSDSVDESRDTTSRTSTRLVKFQLFETKAVSLLFDFFKV